MTDGEVSLASGIPPGCVVLFMLTGGIASLNHRLIATTPSGSTQWI